MSAIVPYTQPIVAQMPLKKKKVNRKKNKINPSPNAAVYNGPLRLPGGSTANDVVSVQLNLIGSVASNGSGVFATVFDAYSQANSSPDWSAYAGLYAEFRILSIDIELVPWNRYLWPTTTNLAPVYSVVDRVQSTALASLNDAASHTASVKIHEGGKKFRRSAKMSGTGEADWTSTSSTPNSDDRFYIKLYSTGNTASLTLYDYLTRCVVQFRERK